MISSKLISDFKRPKGVQYKITSEDGAVVTFSAGPYERGFATTVGSALRRTLLAGLPGYAVIAVHFDKVSSEFENIPGVQEDTAVICVNLKKVAVGMKDANIKNKVLDFNIKGKTTLTAGDFATNDDSLIIGNPAHIILQANEDADFSFRVQISQGRGYVVSNVIEQNIETHGTIPLDANYSPVLRVGFEALPMTMNTRTDFEKLVMEIETNNVLLPQDALELAARTLKECLLTFTTLEAESITTSIDMTPLEARSDEDKIFHASAHSLDVAIPTHYFFRLNNIMDIGELVMENENDLRSRKAFHETILEDIVAQLELKKLKLNMKGVNYIRKKY